MLPLLRIPRSDKKPARRRRPNDTAASSSSAPASASSSWTHPELYAYVHRLTQQFAHCKHSLELSQRKRLDVRDHHFRLRTDLDAVQRDSLIMSQTTLRERKLEMSRRSPSADIELAGGNSDADFDSVIDVEVHRQCAELHAIMRRQERAELGKLSKSEAQMFARVADVLAEISRACVHYLEKLMPALARELAEMHLVSAATPTEDDSDSDCESDSDSGEESKRPAAEVGEQAADADGGDNQPMTDDGVADAPAMEAAGEAASQRREKGPRPLGAGPILTEVNWLAHQHNTCAILAAKYRARAAAHKVELCHTHAHAPFSPLGLGLGVSGGERSALSSLSSSSQQTPGPSQSDAEGSLAALVARKAALTSAVEALKGASRRTPSPSTPFDFGSLASVLSSSDFSSTTSSSSSTRHTTIPTHTGATPSPLSLIEKMLVEVSEHITHLVAAQQLVRRHKIGGTSQTEGEGGSPIAPPGRAAAAGGAQHTGGGDGIVPSEGKREHESKEDNAMMTDNQAASSSSSSSASPKRKFSALLASASSPPPPPPPPPPPLPPAVALGGSPASAASPMRSLVEATVAGTGGAPLPPPPPPLPLADIGSVPFGKMEVTSSSSSNRAPQPQPQPPKDGIHLDNCVYAVHSLSDVLCSFSDGTANTNTNTSGDGEAALSQKSPKGKERRVVRIDVLQSFLERSKGHFRYLEVFEMRRSLPNRLKHKASFDSVESSSRPRKLAKRSDAHTSVSSGGGLLTALSTTAASASSRGAPPAAAAALAPPTLLPPAPLNLGSASSETKVASSSSSNSEGEHQPRKRKRTAGGDGSGGGSGRHQQQVDITQMLRSSKRAALTPTQGGALAKTPVAMPVPVADGSEAAAEVSSLLRSLRETEPRAFVEIMRQFQSSQEKVAAPGGGGTGEAKNRSFSSSFSASASSASGASADSWGASASTRGSPPVPPSSSLMGSPLGRGAADLSVARGERRTTRRRTSPRLAADAAATGGAAGGGGVGVGRLSPHQPTPTAALSASSAASAAL